MLFRWLVPENWGPGKYTNQIRGLMTFTECSCLIWRNNQTFCFWTAPSYHTTKIENHWKPKKNINQDLEINPRFISNITFHTASSTLHSATEFNIKVWQCPKTQTGDMIIVLASYGLLRSERLLFLFSTGTKSQPEQWTAFIKTPSVMLFK